MIVLNYKENTKLMSISFNKSDYESVLFLSRNVRHTLRSFVKIAKAFSSTLYFETTLTDKVVFKTSINALIAVILKVSTSQDKEVSLDIKALDDRKDSNVKHNFVINASRSDANIISIQHYTFRNNYEIRQAIDTIINVCDYLFGFDINTSVRLFNNRLYASYFHAFLDNLLSKVLVNDTYRLI